MKIFCSKWIHACQGNDLWPWKLLAHCFKVKLITDEYIFGITIPLRCFMGQIKIIFILIFSNLSRKKNCRFNGSIRWMTSLTSKWPFVGLQLRTALVALQQRGEVPQRQVARLCCQQDVVADAMQRAAAGLHLALKGECEAAVARARCEQPLRQSRVLLRE